MVEDVITSGKSLLETIDEVENEGLNVSDIVVVLDRQQGGREKVTGKKVTTYIHYSQSQKLLKS